MITDLSLRLESFEIQLRDIVDVDLAQLHALSMSVRWPHRPDDWQMLRQIGRGIAAVDDIGRVIGSAMWFPFGKDFTTVGMVITSPRLQEHGAARWIMDHVLDQIPAGIVSLSATRAARRLYKSLGFAVKRPIYQCQGEVVAAPPVAPRGGASIRPLLSGDLDDVLELDRTAIGGERGELFERLLAQGQGTVLVRDGRVEAFAFCRPFGRGHVVGPLVARSDGDAIAVMAPHVADHLGRFLRIDTVAAEGDFAEYVANAGLATFDIVTAMTLRARPADLALRQTARTYGLTSQALG